jgi:hypothetical protein
MEVYLTMGAYERAWQKGWFSTQPTEQEGGRPRHPNQCRSPSSACQWRIGWFTRLWVRPPGTTPHHP